MKRYTARSGDAGVAAYESGEGWIKLRFRHGGTYLYTDTCPGAEHVAQMQRLAAAGAGLTTYVNQHVREDYAEKLD